jgi:hypothetical protein
VVIAGWETTRLRVRVPPVPNVPPRPVVPPRPRRRKALCVADNDPVSALVESSLAVSGPPVPVQAVATTARASPNVRFMHSSLLRRMLVLARGFSSKHSEV